MKIAFSCVVDAKPHFEWQAFILIQSLLRNVKCDPVDIKVHCLPGVTQSFRNVINNLGIDIIDIQPFQGHPYCNKVQQCFSNVFEEYDKVILLDCDLFFLSSPEIEENIIFAAKIVDLPNPPIEILDEIFRESSIKKPKQTLVDCSVSQEEITYENNLNGGLYVIDQKYLYDIGVTWSKQANWLLGHIDLLGKYHHHVDQISLSLALSQLEINCQHLPARNNFPVHLPVERIKKLKNDNINVLHYHRNILPDGKIKNTGISEIDEQISRVNGEIETILLQEFDNELFWNMRYEFFPNLGSGIGSRSDTLLFKQTLLACTVEGFTNKRVVDVGCGDLELTKTFNFQEYIGYDVSAEALKIAKSHRSDWIFIQGSIVDYPQESADLVICLDVLIHQKTKAEYLQLIEALANVTRGRLIISGYEDLPEAGYISNICAYHEPLSNSLNNLGFFNEVISIGNYRGLTLIVADKSVTGPELHNNDLPIDVFGKIIQYVERKDLLRLIMDISRSRLGFYTKTSIRAIEYPWALEKITEANPTEILDIGAGVSPLPIILAEKGHSIKTIDFHSINRELRHQSGWNEWGFLDYSVIVPTIKSYNLDVLKYHPKKKIDVIYSVSVVEHMPKRIWERLIKLAAKWLKPSGRFIVTLDLIPETELLWNFSEGVEVETPAQHGSLNDFRETLKRNNLIEKDFRIVRNIPSSRTDLALLSCELVLGKQNIFQRILGKLFLWKIF